MKKVKFTVSTGYVGSEREEIFTLEELGIHEEEYEMKDGLLEDIEKAYDEWLWNNINAQWDFED